MDNNKKIDQYYVDLAIETLNRVEADLTLTRLYYAKAGISGEHIKKQMNATRRHIDFLIAVTNSLSDKTK